MLIVGIDPGKKGAIAIIDSERKRESCVFNMPLAEIDVLDIIRKNIAYVQDPVIVYLEQAQSMPGQNSVATFNYGKHYGKLLMGLEILGLPTYLVHPKTWKKKLILSSNKSDSILMARRLFPECSEDLKNKTSDGAAEALLIAEYGRTIQNAT